MRVIPTVGTLSVRSPSLPLLLPLLSARDSAPYVVRSCHCVRAAAALPSGAIMPSPSTGSAAGEQFPLPPGAGANDLSQGTSSAALLSRPGKGQTGAGGCNTSRHLPRMKGAEGHPAGKGKGSTTSGNVAEAVTGRRTVPGSHVPLSMGDISGAPVPVRHPGDMVTHGGRALCCKGKGKFKSKDESDEGSSGSLGPDSDESDDAYFCSQILELRARRLQREAAGYDAEWPPLQTAVQLKRRK